MKEEFVIRGKSTENNNRNITFGSINIDINP